MNARRDAQVLTVLIVAVMLLIWNGSFFPIRNVGPKGDYVDLLALMDVLTVPITCGSGDIGQHFPSDDERWKNADSSIFIGEARRILARMEAEIANVDVTIVAQRPKLAPFRDEIQANIAKLLDLPLGRVNVKATTTDHLGFLGRGEGICAMATLLIEVGA